jgi:hypothetical protein
VITKEVDRICFHGIERSIESRMLEEHYEGEEEEDPWIKVGYI